MAFQQDPKEIKKKFSPVEQEQSKRELGADQLKTKSRTGSNILARKAREAKFEEKQEIIALLHGYTLIVPENGDLVMHNIQGAHVSLQVSGKIRTESSHNNSPFSLIIYATDCDGEGVDLSNILMESFLDSKNKAVPFTTTRKNGILRYHLERGGSYRIDC